MASHGQHTLAPSPNRPQSNDNVGDHASLHARLSGFVSQVPTYASQHPVPVTHNIDPAIAANGLMMNQQHDHHADDLLSTKAAAKRELNTSKRAQQNRAAQRAFRARKETHIKVLQTQVTQYNRLELAHKAVKHENQELRQYIVVLQGRLLELGDQIPPPPQQLLSGSMTDHQAHAYNTTADSSPDPNIDSHANLNINVMHPNTVSAMHGANEVGHAVPTAQMGSLVDSMKFNYHDSDGRSKSPSHLHGQLLDAAAAAAAIAVPLSQTHQHAGNMGPQDTLEARSVRAARGLE